MPKPTENISLEQTMSGVLAMLAAARDDHLNPGPAPEERRKTEVVLSDAGLTPGQIGQILGKKSKLVSQTIIRARKRAGGSGADANE